MEALANYSALLYLEKRDGRSSLDDALDSYRNDLLARDESGQTVESGGPIVLGERLDGSSDRHGAAFRRARRAGWRPAARSARA